MLLLPSAALAQRPPSDSGVAFTHATVIDGAGGPPQGGMTVVVRGGRIVRVGKDETVRVLHGARIIDARGKYLTPGFWDMHVHVAKAGSSSLALFIANGITSVRDMGGDFAMIRSLRDSVRAGTRVGPRITAPGPMLEDAANVARMLSEGTVEPVARFRVPVATAADAERVVDSLAKLGVDFVKDPYRRVARGLSRARQSRARPWTHSCRAYRLRTDLRHERRLYAPRVAPTHANMRDLRRGLPRVRRVVRAYGRR